MVDMQRLLLLQGELFLLMLVGLLFRRKFLGPEFQKGLTDLIVDLVLPCNIVASFQIDAGGETLRSGYTVLLISAAVQAVCGVLAAVLYRRSGPRRAVLQYGTVASNAGFLGTPVAEGIFGDRGVFLASIFLIPQRIVMWSVGVGYFTHTGDWRSTVRRVCTNPCILAVLLGALLMVLRIGLPPVLEESVEALSRCNTALSMFLIGMILSDLRWRDFLDAEILRFCAVRLLLIPALTLLGCRLLRTDALAAHVAVLLVSMPAAGTTAVLASKYGGDTAFAAGVVAVSTVLSLAAIPLWCAVAAAVLG